MPCACGRLRQHDSGAEVHRTYEERKQFRGGGQGLDRQQQVRAGGSVGNFQLGKQRPLVTLGGLGRYSELCEIVLPNFDKEYTQACVIQGEEVLTLRFGEGDTETLCIHSSNSQDQMLSPFIEKNWLVLCQALNQSFSSMSDMHGSLDGLCKKIVVKKARRSIVGLGKLRGERRTGNLFFFCRRGSQKIRFP